MSTLLLSNYGGNLALTALLRAKGLYLAAHTSAPPAASSGQLASEVAGGGYVRQPISFTIPSGKAVANAVKAYFSGMPAVDVWGVAVWDSIGGGNLIVAQELTPHIGVLDGGQLRVEVGDVAFQF